MAPIKQRYDFVLLFDVRDGNPNGDPDAGDLPRMDPETGIGIVTDACLKRRVRNYVGISKGDQPPFEIYLKDRAVLNRQHQRAYDALGLTNKVRKTSGHWSNAENVQAARMWMCRNFYDVRCFGAVMSTGVNCGQVRGPVQLTFARSVDPIMPAEITMVRTAVITESEANRQEGVNRSMWRRFVVPYGLYAAHGFVSPHFAQQTGFSEDDLELLWSALENLFEFDRSTSRGEMTTRGLYIFRHSSPLGNAPAHTLFRGIDVRKRDESGPVPRCFEDYVVHADTSEVPSGVERIVRVGSQA